MKLPFLPFTSIRQNATQDVPATVLAIGLESVGKTQLLARLSGHPATHLLAMGRY